MVEISVQYFLSVEKTGGTPMYSIHMLLQRKGVELRYSIHVLLQRKGVDLRVQYSRVIAEKGGGTQGTVFTCYCRERG